jgi:hypothetical protein
VLQVEDIRCLRQLRRQKIRLMLGRQCKNPARTRSRHHRRQLIENLGLMFPLASLAQDNMSCHPTPKENGLPRNCRLPNVALIRCQVWIRCKRPHFHKRQQDKYRARRRSTSWASLTQVTPGFRPPDYHLPPYRLGCRCGMQITLRVCTQGSSPSSHNYHRQCWVMATSTKDFLGDCNKARVITNSPF